MLPPPHTLMLMLPPPLMPMLLLVLLPPMLTLMPLLLLLLLPFQCVDVAWFKLEVYGGGGLTVGHSQMNKKEQLKKKTYLAT